MSGPDPGPTFDGGREADLPEGGDDGPTYDPKTDTYVMTFESEAASVALMRALADIRHCEATELEPLYSVVDPDALDRVVRSAAESLRVRMTIDGFEVVVTGDRRLEITPPSNTST